MPQAYAIQFDNVSKTYITREGETEAIRDISFQVEEGEFVTLVGPSGCGKSTILSLISGLFQPTAGTVYINGKKVLQPSIEIGYMLQQDYLLSWRKIEENILLGLEIQNKLSVETKGYALSLLEEMGLTSYKKHYPHQLSGGMRQRVALVRTLATNPNILLLDEPFSALDYQTKLKLEDLVRSTLRKRRKTALLVTHDISEAIAMSDKIVILDRNPGRIKKEIILPPELRDPLPVETRDVPSFQKHFHLIWQEMNLNDEKK
ncbi:ABC transporter ATP-binding protein [Microaerobacter geothermalis]|uniref:ABC transporter ATP-binding protein n=1 Tax=Microaerobacter geothermalis TaxID=674972 RepID=UPI001F236AA4|nr:ABC transporter ATP-binding protein [Microaerobacter geothermalis]MCF6092664.1 ABC transporter ATP-binding protein [Microaerobacter geothermalis]